MKVLRVAVLAVLVSIVLGPREAGASQPRYALALLNPPESLTRSAIPALSPWGIDVVSVDDLAPPSETTAALRQARALAATRNVDAVAWFIETSDARNLLVYERSSDQLVSRDVPAGPMDSAMAAANALSLKTVLRSISAHAEMLSQAGSPPPASERQASEGQASERQATWGRLALEGDLGLRVLTGGSWTFDPRFGLGLAWWLGPLRGRAGVALRIEEGTGIPIRTDELTARVDDHAVSFSLRTRMPLSAQLALEPSLGFALHLTLLDGGTVDGHALSGISYVDPAVEFSLLVGYSLGENVRLGLRVGGSLWTRTQSYFVESEATFTLARWQALLAIVACGGLN
jgi:hypothetical protein